MAASARSKGRRTAFASIRNELQARRDLFYAGLADAAPGILSGDPPDGAFYAFVKINPEWARDAGVSRPVPVVGDGRTSDHACPHRLRARRGFRSRCEGYLRFCFGRERKELTGALASMKGALARESEELKTRN